jgi:hypothetical protein
MIKVIEPHKDGRPHSHCLVGVANDVKTGTDIDGLQSRRTCPKTGRKIKGRYNPNAANSALRAIIEVLIEKAPKYGFGVFLAEPIRSTQEAVTRYVGKYISKGISTRLESWKGVRLVEYDRRTKVASSSFAWNTERSRFWREKVKALAGSLGVNSFEELGKALGRRWAFKYQEIIERIRIEYWSLEASENDSPSWHRDVSKAVKLRAQGRELWLTPADAAVEIGLLINKHQWPSVEPWASELKIFQAQKAMKACA